MASATGKSSHTAQMIGSLIVAVVIVVVTISLVTARLGAGEDSGGGSDSGGEDGSGRGRGRSGSGMRDSAPVRFALDSAFIPAPRALPDPATAPARYSKRAERA